MSRRPYVRKTQGIWWLSRRFYTVYMLRELTSLALMLYSILLTFGLIRLAQGAEAWQGFLAAVSSPLMVIFQLICLVAVVFHAVTWFQLTPRASPILVKGEFVPASTIISIQYGVWAVVSVVILLAAGV